MISSHSLLQRALCDQRRIKASRVKTSTNSMKSAVVLQRLTSVPGEPVSTLQLLVEQDSFRRVPAESGDPGGLQARTGRGQERSEKGQKSVISVIKIVWDYSLRFKEIICSSGTNVDLLPLSSSSPAEKRKRLLEPLPHLQGRQEPA